MASFIFTTTGLEPIVRFEELGAYFEHPISSYTLSDYFEIEEIIRSQTIQDAIDNGHITAVDENGNLITNLSYVDGNVPIFEIDNYNSVTTYVGYGEQSACKILKISSSNSSYTSLWSEGSESFDKIWSNRYNYNYF